MTTELFAPGDFSAVYKDTHGSNEPQIEHYHDSYELDFFVNANIRMFIKDVSYFIMNGDILFINEYDIHRVVNDSPSRYTRYVVNFRRRFIEPFLQELGIGNFLTDVSDESRRRARVSLKQVTEVTVMFEELVTLFNKLGQPGDHKMILALIKTKLFFLLYKTRGLLREETQAVSAPAKEQQVQGIVRFIDANYMHPLSLESLEETFNLSKYYICHIFGDITGFSVFEYLQYRRIIEAQKLLDSTDDNVTDICYRVGFNNPQHFYRVFKKICGTTPLQYRKG